MEVFVFLLGAKNLQILLHGYVFNFLQSNLHFYHLLDSFQRYCNEMYCLVFFSVVSICKIGPIDVC